MSHPVRVRGLKPYPPYANTQLTESHPVRVRGLKHAITPPTTQRLKSHPVRVRGLKLSATIDNSNNILVAPRAGAWIETNINWGEFGSECGRTPCGCVD